VGPAGFTFRGGKDVVPRSALPREFHAVLSGHIHRRQVLEGTPSGGPPVLYPGSVERTSFAEKDEEKGFYEIEFSRTDRGAGRLDRWVFRALPARPMIDVFLTECPHGADPEGWLKARLSKIDPNAVVRMTASPQGEDPENSRGRWTHSLFRRAVPETMNYRLGASVTRWLKGGKPA
jgi:hypothetical protein